MNLLLSLAAMLLAEEPGKIRNTLHPVSIKVKFLKFLSKINTNGQHNVIKHASISLSEMVL